jgi:hypothetical protein
MSERLPLEVAEGPGRLFSQGNSKVGPHVFIFNLPVRKSCPGMSPVCEEVCYAMPPGVWPKWLEWYGRNLVVARQPEFVRRAITELRERDARLLRIHTSGDYFEAGYVRKWVEILRAVPRVTAWSYTRSWWSRRTRQPSPGMIEELRTLAALPNMHLWFSTDASMGLPPPVENVRVVFLQVEVETVPDSEGLVELVFREKQRWRQPAERLALPLAPAPPLICPHHQCVETTLTCETCRYCFR